MAGDRMPKGYRIGSASNLTSAGQLELLLLSFPDDFPEGRMVFDFDETPRKIEGLQKVAQLFLKILRTQKGSDPINQVLGTNFNELVQHANRIKTDTVFVSDLTAAIKDAEVQVKSILNAYSGAVPDPSNTLTKIDVLGFDTTSDSVTMFVKIITGSGEQAQVSVPFPELDLKTR